MIYVDRVIEKPVTVEKIVEVPVEKIVEKVVEVEKIVTVEKPYEVEKIVYVDKPVEVERIVEVQVPVEVEKIVEVDKIIEVPVERIVEKIVEVPVERIVEKVIEQPAEDPKVDELADEVQRLLAELEAKDKELQFRSRADSVREAIAATADDVFGNIGTASFGTTWPSNPARGDLFLKVDVKPNILYKWNNRKWIQIDKGRVDDTLAYDPAYIDHVIQEVRKGHREYDDLSDIERKQIMARIRGGNQS